MNFKIILVNLLFIIFCINTSLFADEINQAVNDFCGCAKPAYAKHKEIMAIVKKQNLVNNPQKMEEVFKKLEKEAISITNCFKDIERKYKSRSTDEVFGEKVKEGIDRECPKPSMQG